MRTLAAVIALAVRALLVGFVVWGLVTLLGLP